MQGGANSLFTLMQSGKWLVNINVYILIIKHLSLYVASEKKNVLISTYLIHELSEIFICLPA